MQSRRHPLATTRSDSVCYPRAMPIIAYERRDLLRTERSRDPDAIALAIRRVLADNPTAGLLEIEMMLRAAASSAFVIADGDGFRVVIGFRA